MCVCVCMYVCMYVCVYVYKHVCVCAIRVQRRRRYWSRTNKHDVAYSRHIHEPDTPHTVGSSQQSLSVKKRDLMHSWHTYTHLTHDTQMVLLREASASQQERCYALATCNNNNAYTRTRLIHTHRWFFSEKPLPVNKNDAMHSWHIHVHYTHYIDGSSQRSLYQSIRTTLSRCDAAITYV